MKLHLTTAQALLLQLALLLWIVLAAVRDIIAIFAKNPFLPS